MSKVSPANQHTNDEREQKCWDFYVEGVLRGEENSYAAAVKAGYSDDHSRNITIQGWFVERKARLKRKDMLSKAERVLDRTLDATDEKLAQDTAKFVAKTLGKDDGYSERSEITGKDGKDLFNPSDEDKESAKKALEQINT